MGLIYAIFHCSSSRIYVGQTTMSLRDRIQGHLQDLRLGEHKNQYLQSTFTKYGEDDFLFYIIEDDIDRVNLTEREMFWMDYYNSFDHEKGFNLRRELPGNSHTVSDEQREKMRQKAITRWSDPNYVARHREGVQRALDDPQKQENHRRANQGEERKKKLSDMAKQRAKNPEYIEKLRRSATGRPSPNKGKTYEEIHGIEGAAEKRRKTKETRDRQKSNKGTNNE